MVKEEKLLHPGTAGELSHIIHARMPPANVLLVLLTVVLRVHDQHTGITEEFHEHGILLLGVFDRFCVAATWLRTHAVKWFVIGNEDDVASARLEAISDTNAGVID